MDHRVRLIGVRAKRFAQFSTHGVLLRPYRKRRAIADNDDRAVHVDAVDHGVCFAPDAPQRLGVPDAFCFAASVLCGTAPVGLPLALPRTALSRAGRAPP